jgi:hypothetical protein
MLEGLDNVDWKSLTHAYGSAEDVPDQLRALAFGDTEERESAVWSLYGNIYHQGTVYQATAYAVPFLVEMITAPAFPKKEEVLLLLLHLASGHSYLDAHQHFEWEKQKAAKDPEGYQAQLQEELGWVQAARQAVDQAHPTYIALLDAEEAKTRATAAYLLSGFREHHATFLPILSQRLAEESDTSVESALILSLGYLAPYGHTDTVATVEPYLAPDYPLLTRWAAAMTMARLLTTTTPDGVLSLLVKILQSGEAIEELETALQEIPWWEGGGLGATCTTLGFMNKGQVAPFLPQIFGALPDIPWTSMESVVYALLYLVFDGEVMAESLRVRDLDEIQVRTLTAIADHAIEIQLPDRKVSQNANVLSVLRSFQVPDSQEKLRGFLNEGKGGL